MNKYVLPLGLLLAVAAISSSAEKEKKKESEPERMARAAMKKHYLQMTDKQLITKAWMNIVERNGRKQTRHMWRMSETNKKDEERYVVVFDSPPAIRHTAVLLLEHRGRDDDTWVYLPAIRKTMRISGTNLRQSWAGTEFSYKDLKRESVSANRYVLVKTEKQAGQAVKAPAAKKSPTGKKGRPKSMPTDLLVIDAFPVTKQEKAEQGYSRRRLWIRSDNYLATRIEYYNKRNKLLKTLVASDLRHVGKTGKVRAYKSTMTNRKGRRTEVRFEEIHINEGDIDDRIFTRRYIERSR
jgi:Outer membrane lipoprotein-sorting protein